MKLWFDPQISEHWPYYKPGCVDTIIVWFRQPGIASVFNPREGTAHECNTSLEEINILIVISIGNITWLSTASSRSSPGFSSDVGIM